MKHLIITVLLVLMTTSCETRMTVMNTEDGKISTVRKSSYDITKVNDFIL